MTPPPPWARDAKGTITTAPVFEARQDMTDDPVQHRIYHHTPADSVELRESDEDGVFAVRMPIATTGEVRNQGDEPLTREELDGMRRQVADGGVGVFLDHGADRDVAATRYGATGKIGEWADPETTQRDADGTDQLVATARLMDPETLPEAAGSVREALTVLKEQATRGMSLSASIGWRDAEDSPGGVDLMETSIVGIPADPRTTSDHTPASMAARALTADGREEFEDRLEELRAVVMEPDDEAGNGRDSVTDEPDEPGDDPDNDRGEQDGMDAEEFREQMLEMQRQQTETLSTLSNALREDDEDDDEEDEDEDEEDDDRGADEDDVDDEERALEVDGEEVTADDVRVLREQLEGAEPGEPEERDADDEEEEQDEERTADPKELLS